MNFSEYFQPQIDEREFYTLLGDEREMAYPLKVYLLILEEFPSFAFDSTRDIYTNPRYTTTLDDFTPYTLSDYLFQLYVAKAHDTVLRKFFSAIRLNLSEKDCMAVILLIDKIPSSWYYHVENIVPASRGSFAFSVARHKLWLSN